MGDRVCLKEYESVAALAMVFLFVFDGEGRGSSGAFDCALIETHHLFGQFFEEVVDVLGCFCAGLHEGQLVAIGCIFPKVPN